MSQTLLEPPMAKVEEGRQQSADTVFCIHCFETLEDERGQRARFGQVAVHACAEKALASQPAAPPPYN